MKNCKNSYANNETKSATKGRASTEEGGSKANEISDGHRENAGEQNSQQDDIQSTGTQTFISGLEQDYETNGLNSEFNALLYTTLADMTNNPVTKTIPALKDLPRQLSIASIAERSCSSVPHEEATSRCVVGLHGAVETSSEKWAVLRSLPKCNVRDVVECDDGAFFEIKNENGYDDMPGEQWELHSNAQLALPQYRCISTIPTIHTNTSEAMCKQEREASVNVDNDNNEFDLR